jgi:hypothetical protein
VQYQIIAANSPDQLEDFVNNELRHRWEVTGDLSTYTVRDGATLITDPKLFFAQAMIGTAPQPGQAQTS